MPDMEKVISGFEQWCDDMDEDCPVVCLAALALLKEHDEHLHELQQIINDGFDAMKVATKRIKKLESMLKEQPQIVRCKDCKIGAVEIHDYMLPFVTCEGRDHPLDWFCGDGVKRE